MGAIIAISDKRNVPKHEQERYVTLVLSDVLEAVSGGEVQSKASVKAEAQRRAIAHAKTQLMDNVEQALVDYHTIRHGCDHAALDAGMREARRKVEMAIEQLAAFAIGGRAKKMLQEPLCRDVLDAVGHMFGTGACTACAESRAREVWAKIVTLAAEREGTSIALWWEVNRLQGDGSSRAHRKIMNLLHRIAIQFTPKRAGRVHDAADIAHNVWCELRGLMNHGNLDLIVDMDAFFREMARKRGISVTRSRQVDRNTDHCTDVDSLTAASSNPAEQLYHAELVEQVRTIIQDPAWRIHPGYRKLLHRMWVECIDKEDAIAELVDELLADPANDKNHEALFKRVRKWHERAMALLRQRYFEQYMGKKGKARGGAVRNRYAHT